jgi:multimeric flavodoxin WrbA
VINALGICASPRRKGNSELLLDNFLEGAKSEGASVKKLILIDLRLEPCQECDTCGRYRERALKNDVRGLFRLFDESDIIAIATPIYFGSMTAQLKTMIDRFQPLWVKKEIFKRPPLTPKCRKGIFLCVSAAVNKDYFRHAGKGVRILFSMLGIRYSDEIYCGGVNKKGDIRKKGAVLKRARLLGEEVVLQEAE